MLRLNAIFYQLENTVTLMVLHLTERMKLLLNNKNMLLGYNATFLLKHSKSEFSGFSIFPKYNLVRFLLHTNRKTHIFD